MKRSGIAPVLFGVLALLCLPGRVLSAQSRESGEVARAQADAFLQQADAAFAGGAADQANALLASALQLSPDYSEALYLRARLEIVDRAGTRAAIADLRAALNNRTWKSTDPDGVEQMLAGVLLRTGSLAEARTLLEPLSARHPEDAQDLLLLARLFARSGDQAREGRTLADGMMRFPLRDEFRHLSSGLLEEQGKRQAARDVVSTGLKIHPDSLVLLLDKARLEGTAARRRDAVNPYLDKGGKDPLAAVLALEASPKGQKRYLDSFLANDGLGRQDLVDRAVAAVRGSPELARSLSSSLAAFSGTRDLDPDASGYWRERWTFEKGKVSGWNRDPARDGVPQYVAQFVDGLPSTLAYSTREGVRVTLKYSRYPFIESAESPRGTRLFLEPYTVQCAFLQPHRGAETEGLAPRIAAKIVTPSPDRLLAASYRREEYAPDGVTVVRATELSHGMPLFMEEDTNGDGTIDHRVWYENGRAVRGERSLIGNGVFTVAETWNGGKLVAAAFDMNDDGKVEYREVYGAQPMKLWDYDEDGRIDSREYPGANGTVIREFASSRNGVFDLRIVWSGARIVQVLRSGSALAVSADRSRGVTWIGQPASAGVRPDASQPDGVQLLGGREYLVFHYAGITYAEVVR